MSARQPENLYGMMISLFLGPLLHSLVRSAPPRARVTHTPRHLDADALRQPPGYPKSASSPKTVPKVDRKTLRTQRLRVSDCRAVLAAKTGGKTASKACLNSALSEPHAPPNGCRCPCRCLRRARWPGSARPVAPPRRPPRLARTVTRSRRPRSACASRGGCRRRASPAAERMAERSARRHRLLTVHAIVVQDVHRPVVAHLLHHAGVPANQPGLRASPDVLVHIISVCRTGFYSWWSQGSFLAYGRLSSHKVPALIAKFRRRPWIEDHRSPSKTYQGFGAVHSDGKFPC